MTHIATVRIDQVTHYADAAAKSDLGKGCLLGNAPSCLLPQSQQIAGVKHGFETDTKRMKMQNI